eukprot:gene19908-23817_t
MAGPHGEDPIAAQEDETPKEWDYMLREFDGSRLDGSEPRPDAPMEDTEERGLGLPERHAPRTDKRKSNLKEAHAQLQEVGAKVTSPPQEFLEDKATLDISNEFWNLLPPRL